MPFRTELNVQVVTGGRYQLLSPFIYRVHGAEITVPTAFITDFASIPRGFRWLVTGHDNTRKPAVIHDYLYYHGAGSRKAADIVFKTAMKEAGVSRAKRNLCYWAVRVGGRGSWGRK